MTAHSVHRRLGDVRILEPTLDGGAMGGAAIAVMRLREMEVRDAFQSAGAVNPATAMSLESIGIDENLAVRRLKRRAVIREAAPGLFYFDEDVWQALRAMRRRMAFLLLGTLTLLLLLILYGTVTLT